MSVAKQTFIVLLLVLCTQSAKATPVCQGTSGGREGQCAPDFALKDRDGKSVHLSDFRGKVVFLNFWATWCEPCVIEMPILQNVAKFHEKKSFVMLAVNVDEQGSTAVEKFLKERLNLAEPAYHVLYDSNQSVAQRYGTFKFPETYIIDKGGRITDKVEGVRDWDDGLLMHYLKLVIEK